MKTEILCQDCVSCHKKYFFLRHPARASGPLALPGAGFLGLSTADILGWKTLCRGVGCPVQCKTSAASLVPTPLAGVTLSPAVTTQTSQALLMPLLGRLQAPMPTAPRAPGRTEVWGGAQAPHQAGRPVPTLCHWLAFSSHSTGC